MRIRPVVHRNRRGFTLIELLVVIGIIAVLVSLVAGAIFRVQTSQSQKRTEATVKKIQTGLNLQWQAVISDVKNEVKNSSGFYGNAQALASSGGAGGNRDLTNVLYLKMRLLQEFPQNFAEVLGGVSGIPPKAAYVSYLNGATSAGSLPMESAICLYMALTQSRRGAAFNGDDVGAGASVMKSYGGQQFKVFVDSYGRPITFERWISATGTGDFGVLSQDLTQAPYVPASSGGYDLDDPLHALANSGFNPGVAPVQLQPGLTQLIAGPVVRSWGRDGIEFTGDDILGYRLTIQGNPGN